MNPSPDPLDELLNQLHATPEPSARLADQVRRRLASRPAAPCPTWLERLDAVCARPSFAATFVAACLLFGLFLAEARISRLQAAQSAQIARSYLRLIDPLLDSAPTPAPTASRSP